MADISRREALTYGAAGALALGAAAGSAMAGETSPSLSALAKAKGLRFGTAIAAHQLDDPKYLDLVRRECGTLVAENEHKMYVIEREKGAYNFAPADALVAFAKTNKLMMRGHTLVWHHPRWLPQWVNETQFADAAAAEAVLGGYIARVAGRYSPFLYSWDVVNETIDPATGGLRETSFSRAMGPEVIDFCFHSAREAAPTAGLAYNDYMSWEDGHEKHRAGVLNLLEGLLKRGAPIDALGVQSHSNDSTPDKFNASKQKAWRAFMDEVTGMGLDVYMTEYDVNDTGMTADIETRDTLMASYTRDYLDLMFSYPQVKELLVWGLVDKYSWLQNFKPRTDGVQKRPTPFDSNYQPKKMRDAIGDALKAAPGRTLG